MIKTKPVDDTYSYSELNEEDTNYFKVRMIRTEPEDDVNEDTDRLSAPEDDLSRSWTENINSWNQYVNYTPQWMCNKFCDNMTRCQLYTICSDRTEYAVIIQNMQ